MSHGVPKWLPKWLTVNPNGIPDELKQLPQWVTWAFEARAEGEQPTKIPYSPRSLPCGWAAGYRYQRARANDPGTWSDFAAAMKGYTEREGFAGIGFEFAADGGLVGVDLDKCRDPHSGELADWAAEVVRRFNTYAEVSPSGTGVKLWCRGKIPGDGKGKKRPFRTGAVEMYGQGRYFAMTGHVLESSPTTIRDAQAEIEWLWQAAFAQPTRSRIRENSGSDQSGSRIRQNSGGNEPGSRIRENSGRSEPPPPDFSRSRLHRAKKYVAKMPPAITGQGGHDQTFAVACALVLGFDLTPDQAFPLLAEYSQRCEPPWSEAELRHKLDDADKQPGERGYLRDAHCSRIRENSGRDTLPPDFSRSRLQDDGSPGPQIRNWVMAGRGKEERYSPMPMESVLETIRGATGD